MRVTIIGLPGSGKSTVADMIAEKLSIPHIHIDRFWFEAGGRTGEHDTPNIEQVREYVREKVLEAISAESWVSDGFYSRVQPEIASRADVVLFLDIPPWLRLLNHATRTLQRDNRHKEVSVWDDITFFSEVVRRTFRTGPKLHAFVNQFKDKTVILRSRKEIDQYVNRL
jgi:adenylate kinase family enzyme